MSFTYPPDRTKYRNWFGNWKPRRKPHFIPIRGGSWQVIQRLPGSAIAKCAIANTPADALALLESCA
jgi:hypothetical protein